jgi:hypothetical protein
MNVAEENCDKLSKRQSAAASDIARKEPEDSQATLPGVATVFGSAASRRRKFGDQVSKKQHKLFGRNISSPGGTPGFPAGSVSLNSPKASTEDLPESGGPSDPIFDYSRSPSVESDSHTKSMEAEADRKARKRMETNRTELLELQQANDELRAKSRDDKHGEMRVEAAAEVAHNNSDPSAKTTSTSTVLSDTEHSLQTYKSPHPELQLPLDDSATSKTTEEIPHEESSPPSSAKGEAAVDDEQQETGLGQFDTAKTSEQIESPDQSNEQSQVSAQLAALDGAVQSKRPSDQLEAVNSAEQPEQNSHSEQIDVVESIEHPGETSGGNVRDGILAGAPRKAEAMQASSVGQTRNEIRLTKSRTFVLLLHDAIRSTEPQWSIKNLSDRLAEVMRTSGWHMHLLFTASALWVGLKVIEVDECRFTGALPIRETRTDFS